MSLAFICFYGQIRSPQQAFNSLKDLRERLASENYDVKIFAHLWYDFNEGQYENSKNADMKSSKENLDFFLSEFKPTKVLIEQPRKFSLEEKSFNKVNYKMGNGSNILSQMHSRMKTRNLVKDYCKELTDTALLHQIPVFMLRLDFINRVDPDILKEFQDAPTKIFLAQGYDFNDNFIVLNANNFLMFFNQLDDRTKEFLENDFKLPTVYGWWCPESILKARSIDLCLNPIYTRNIPNFH
jgi:hypothetical protein